MSPVCHSYIAGHERYLAAGCVPAVVTPRPDLADDHVKAAAAADAAEEGRQDCCHASLLYK